jgi:ankyrin repeat protein
VRRNLNLESDSPLLSAKKRRMSTRSVSDKENFSPIPRTWLPVNNDDKKEEIAAFVVDLTTVQGDKEVEKTPQGTDKGSAGDKEEKATEEIPSHPSPRRASPTTSRLSGLSSMDSPLASTMEQTPIRHTWRPPQPVLGEKRSECNAFEQIAFPIKNVPLNPITSYDPFICYPLHTLVGNNNLLELERLLKLGGLPIDAMDPTRRTPIRVAIEKKNYKCLELLLRYHADINQADSFGDTLVHSVAREGDLIAMDILIRFNPNLLIKNILGELPIFSSFYSNNKEIGQLLWRLTESKNYLIEHRTFSNFSLLHYAAAYSDELMIRTIMSHLHVLTQVPPLSTTLLTPLHVAASKNSYACIDLLLKLWPFQTRFANIEGKFPIHMVENIDALKAFEDFNQKEVEIKDNKEGNRLIHFAARKGLVLLIAYILNKYPGMWSIINMRGENWYSIANSKTRDDVYKLLPPSLSFGNK